MAEPRLVVGISGASGVAYGVRLLELLRPTPVQTHLVVTKSARMTLAYETDMSLADLTALADVSYSNTDLGAAISSGSFRTLGMVVAPCSMRTLAEIAHGGSTTLLTRAADVVLKERKRLVLLARETPLNLALDLQHAGVPIIAPGAVRGSSARATVGGRCDSAGRAGFAVSVRARPKSRILTRPCLSMRTFAGLTSRWTILCSWANWSARAIVWAMRRLLSASSFFFSGSV